MTDENNRDWRADLRIAVENKDGPLAQALMVERWAKDGGPMLAPVVNQTYAGLGDLCGLAKPKPVKISILRSFSVEPVIPVLQAAARLKGIDPDIAVSDFNTVAQDILTPDSIAYRAGTDAVIIARLTRDVAPELWHGEMVDVQAVIDRVVADYENLIGQFRAHSDAYLIVHGLEAPVFAADGIAGKNSGHVTHAINQALHDMAENFKGVYILDYDGLVARHGRMNWSDEVRWHTMRLPLAMENLVHLAHEWLRFVVPVSGKIAKALVVDLDNTLWGGIVGEDGKDGLRLDGDYPGAAFQDIQRALKTLINRGIALAICSKNNLDDAIDVIENHPGMILKKDDFAVLRINWQDKATNIKDIADELNIATDAVAFLDDNPAERLQVRQTLPEVNVIELGDDPFTYAKVVMSEPGFERLALTGDDRARVQYYRQNSQRRALQNAASSIEDFYRSLEMTLMVEEAGPHLVTRLAQMTQKTNQFNMTTRRYSEQQIENFLKNPDASVFAVSAWDRFGENGVIGLMIVNITKGVADIDSFLMSCRVIGRTLETAFLATVSEILRDQGVKKITGCYIPTDKNKPAKNVYKDHGFDEIDENDGIVRGQLDLTKPVTPSPEWITVIKNEKD